MDNANEELSKRLHTILDAVGASEYTRKKYWEVSMFQEITDTFYSQLYDNESIKRSFYTVGSSCEGTTTPGLYSDIDIINCYEDSPVVENLFEAKQQGKSYLILTDEFTNPGYVRLQIIKDRLPLLVGMCDVSEDRGLKIDRKGKICFTHFELTFGQTNFRNGPANTFPCGIGYYQTDVVYALRCRQIPRSANHWLHKKRKYDWPSEKQLRKMGSYGCFLVGVGHPHSDNKSIEWRISFSLQERYLMSSINETQHKCYILLKMIKKDLIESNAGESISSYHCKTSLFYTIENSEGHMWKDGNLILCVRLCLKRILNWVKAKKCPNYFIPEENMFDKLSPITLKTIENILIDIIDNGVNFLYTLTCESLGELLKSEMCGFELVCSLNKTITKRKLKVFVYGFFTKAIYAVRNIFLLQIHLSYDTHTSYVKGVMQILLYLQNTNHVTEHTTREVKMAFDSLIPHIKLQYEQCMFAQYLSRGDLSCLWLKTFQNVVSKSISDHDLISSKLSLASLYIQYEQLQEECQCILMSCENNLKPYVISMCACHQLGLHSNPAVLEKLRYIDMTSNYFRRHCTTGCMVFHPSQVVLVHDALKYELFRTVYTEPVSEIYTFLDYWCNWITIDSQIYLYFLQYLLYSKAQKKTETETAGRKLWHVLKIDHNLGHKETALNIWGWICLQENELQVAWSCFCQSWKVRPFKNAAKWHMLNLLYEVIN